MANSLIKGLPATAGLTDNHAVEVESDTDSEHATLDVLIAYILAHAYTEERVQDIVGALVVAAGGTYDDALGTVVFPGGGTSGTKTLAVFTPMTSQPPASNFATLDTRNSIAVLDFDDTTQENVFWVGCIPEGADLSSGIKVRIFLGATTATSGDVRFGAKFEKMTSDIDSDSFDTGVEVVGTIAGTSGVFSWLEITCTAIDSLAAGDPFRLSIFRNAGHSSDTMVGDCEIACVEVRQVA